MYSECHASPSPLHLQRMAPKPRLLASRRCASSTRCEHSVATQSHAMDEDFVIIYDSRKELVRILEHDPIAINSILTAEGLLSPQLVSEILTLDTNKRKAQKLVSHILRERETHSDWYYKFLSFVSRHEWLAEINTILNDLSCELIPIISKSPSTIHVTRST